MQGNHKILKLITFGSLAAFILLTYGFGGNSECMRNLGCNYGFFGYDALWHLIGGILAGSAFVLISGKRPRYFALLAIVTLASVGWEALEFGHDKVFNRIPVINKIEFLHFERVAQPSNADTVGDLLFSIAGAAIAGLFI